MTDTSKKSIREMIKDFKDYVIEKVEVPQWPSEWDIHVRTMTGRSLNAITMWRVSKLKLNLNKNKDEDEDEFEYDGSMNEDYTARVVMHTACDKDGNLLFCEGDLEWLTNKSGLALQTIQLAADKLSARLPEVIDEMQKKSESSPT